MGRSLPVIGILAIGLAAATPSWRGAGAPVPPPAAAAAQEPKPAVRAVHQDGTALLAAFYGDSGRAAHPESLTVLIVLLPDPVSSHLDWSYDSMLEALRRAMEQAGNVVDRFWLPWRSNGDTTGARYGIADSLTGARWPGVMLFRNAHPAKTALTLVYVVGDVPTSGVQRLALREALNERRRLLASSYGASNTIRIVGPVFSGSSISLRNAIDTWRDSTGDKSFVNIVSGSASDFANLGTLSASDRRFSATVHTSGWLTVAAESVLARRLGILPKELALLHEGTTQYGRIVDRDFLAPGGESGPLNLAFPMNISSLQVQYARHPDPGVSQPGPEGLGARPTPRIGLDQREPAALTESPAAVSQLTAPAVEILLAQIERSLAAHRIRAVGIVATDVRDELFLAGELRTRVHDVQVVFFDSNVLFLRPEYQKALKGALVVSTYPLFLENQYWDLTQRNRERLVFMSDQSEGLFNAVLSQIDSTQQLTEYATPMDTVAQSHRTGPPTWVTVIGRDGIYPVTLAEMAIGLDGYADTNASEARYLLKRSANRVYTKTEPSRPAWEFVMPLALLFLGFVYSFVVLQQRTIARPLPPVWPSPRNGGESAQKRQLDQLDRTARSASLRLHRELYILLRYFCLVAAVASVLLVLIRPRAHGLSASSVVLWGLVALTGAASLFVFDRSIRSSWRALSSDAARQANPETSRWIVASYVLAGRWPRPGEHTIWVEFVMRGVVLVLGFAYTALTLYLAIQVKGLGQAESAFFFQRAVSLEGGVSPAVPLVLSALALAAWCSWHLRRISLLAEPTVYEDYLVTQDRLATEKQKQREMNALKGEVAQVWRGVARVARPRKVAGPDAGVASTDTPPVERRWARAEADRALEIANRADQLVEPLGLGPELRAGDAPFQRDAARIRDLAIQADKAARRMPATENNAQGAATPALSRPLTRFDRRRVQAGLREGIRSIDGLLERPAGGTATERLPKAARSVHEQLLYLFPPRTASPAMLIAMVPVAWWMISGFGRSMESMILPQLSWFGGATSFDVLFRFSLLAIVGLTVWAIYRLASVWSGIRTILNETDEDLLPSFTDLPARLARVSRLTPFGHASRVEINEITDEKWSAMLDAFRRLDGSTKAKLFDSTKIDRFDKRPGSRTQPFELTGDDYKGFLRLKQALDFCRREHLLVKRPKKTPDGGEDPAATAHEWARRCADLYALYVADYVDWVFQHMRYLASFVLIALVLTVLLLSSYPFQPQSVVIAVFGVVFIVAVSMILYIVTAMNRDRVLSAISNTEAGAVNWDSHFLVAVATYGAVPLVTLISAAFPQVRGFLFSWVTPLLRALTKG